MLISKKEVLIDARTGQKGKVIIDCPVFNWDEINGKVGYLVIIKTLKENLATNKIELVELHRLNAVYKMETFLKIMSGISFEKYKDEKNAKMAAQIEYNSKDYYGLMAQDFEEYKP